MAAIPLSCYSIAFLLELASAPWYLKLMSTWLLS